MPWASVLLARPRGACSYRLGSLFGQDEPKAEVTGSIASHAAATDQAGAAAAATHLAYVRAAATQALAIDGKTTSVPWENPQTGARGTVTPIAAAYTQDG